MATTANDLIDDALEMLGVKSPGDPTDAADQQTMLLVLNALLDELAAEQVFVYGTTALSLTLTINRGIYTIGNTGAPDINAPRPPAIAMGPNAASLLRTGVTYPLNVVSAIEYKAALANAPVPGTPNTLNYTDGYPLGTLKLLPVPAVVYALTFQSWVRILSFPTLTTGYTLAVGVFDCLRQNLAVSGKTYFRDAAIDPLIIQAAVVSRAFLRLQSINSRAMLDRFQLPTNPAKPS